MVRNSFSAVRGLSWSDQSCSAAQVTITPAPNTYLFQLSQSVVPHVAFSYQSRWLDSLGLFICSIEDSIISLTFNYRVRIVSMLFWLISNCHSDEYLTCVPRQIVSPTASNCCAKSLIAFSHGRRPASTVLRMTSNLLFTTPVSACSDYVARIDSAACRRLMAMHSLAVVSAPLGSDGSDSAADAVQL